MMALYNYLKALFFTKRYRLAIFMKSGNVIEIDGITEYEFKSQGAKGITSFEVKWVHPRTRLLVKTIDLAQIEAITVR